MALNETSQVPCTVVRDLLPNSLDGLTSAETDEIIRTHLENCPECRAACAAMRQAEPEKSTPESAPADAAKIRYLKKIKRKHLIRIFAVVVVLLASFSLFTYFVNVHTYPYPVDKMRVADVYRLEDGTLYIRVYVEGKLAAVNTFAYQSTFTDSEGRIQFDAAHGGTQYEFQMGYRMSDLWAADASVEGGYLSFFVAEGDEGDGVYFRGWGGGERLLLWQEGGAAPPAPAELEEMLDSEFGKGSFATGGMVYEGVGE